MGRLDARSTLWADGEDGHGRRHGKLGRRLGRCAARAFCEFRQLDGNVVVFCGVQVCGSITGETNVCGGGSSRGRVCKQMLREHIPALATRPPDLAPLTQALATNNPRLLQPVRVE